MNHLIFIVYDFEGVNDFVDEVDTISTDAIDSLAKRGITKTADSKYIFTRDLKQRILSLYGYPTDVIVQFAKRVKCPHLVIKATRHPERWKFEQEPVNSITNVYKNTNCDNFCISEVDGNHALHLTHPENVWQAIESFLTTKKHKL